MTTDFAGSQERRHGRGHAARRPARRRGGILESVLAGNFDFAVGRYNVDGSLDRSFDGDGHVTTEIAAGRHAEAGIVLQSDGKLVVGGIRRAAAGPPGFRPGPVQRGRHAGPVVRRGRHDRADFGGTFESGLSLALQVDGKVVLGGVASGQINGQSATDALIARFDTDGSVDPTFGINGFTTVDFVGRAEAQVSITVAFDGKIVLVATTPSTIGFPFQDLGVARVDGLTPHALTFFLQGRHVPETAGGFTMNQTAPASQFLLVNFAQTPAWFSEPVVQGTLLPGGSVRLQVACTAGLGLPKTVQLAATAPDGSHPQVLGEVSQGLSLCLGTQTITIPVTRPVTLANQRLRLTIASSIHVPIFMRLGDRTFLQADAFIGAP